MKAVKFAILSSVLLGSLPAFGQITGEQAKTMASQEKSALPPSTFGGEIGFGQINEDFFLNLNLRLNLDFEMFGFGIQTPLRLRIIDRDPKDRDDDYGKIIRREDWDQISDWFKIVRYVYIGQFDKKGPFYVRIGELSNLSIGHGTIMHRYYNTLDISRWHLGINAAVNVWAVGAEVMASDVTGPHVVGGRVHVRPMEIVMGEGFWSGLHVGASLFGDATAPFSLQRDATGAVVVDDAGVPDVDGARSLFVGGADVGFEVLSTEIISITPYVDLNKIGRVRRGFGFHGGVLWNIHVPIGIGTFLVDLRTEYRRVNGDYLAPYFDSVYEIERFQRLSFGDADIQAAPKLYTLECNRLDLGPCNQNTGPGKNGMFFELLAGLPDWVLVGGSYTDYDGGKADGILRLSLEVPALSFLKFAAFYYRVNISGADDLFGLDNKSALVGQATIPVYSIIAINLRYWRVWEADGQGGYSHADNWDASIGFSIEL